MAFWWDALHTKRMNNSNEMYFLNSHSDYYVWRRNSCARTIENHILFSLRFDVAWLHFAFEIDDLLPLLLPTNLFFSHFNEALIDSVEIYSFDSMCADCSTRWLWVLYLLLCSDWVVCTLLAGIYAHLFAYDDLG